MIHEDLHRSINETSIQIAGLIRSSDLSKDVSKERLYQRIMSLMNRLNDETQAVMPYAVAHSYYVGYQDAMKRLGMPYDDLVEIDDNLLEKMEAAGMSRQIHVEAIEAALDDTLLDLTTAYKTAADSAINTIDHSIATIQQEVAQRFITGVSKEVITERVVQAFIKDGFTAFTTSDNKQLPLDFYARTVVNTKLAQADANGHLNRYRESDVDLVEFLTAGTSCGHCASHRGLIFSISGNSEQFPPLPPNLIPVHPNCRCTWIPVSLDYFTDDELQQAVDRQAKGIVDIRTDHEKLKYEERVIRRRKKQQDQRLYKRMLAKMPKETKGLTFNEFEHMRAEDNEEFRDLYSTYLSYSRFPF